jgi:hypothetical protein
MAKNSSTAKGKADEGLFPFRTLQYIYTNSEPVTVDTALRYVLSMACRVPDMPDPTDPRSERDFMLVQVGPPGIGKTKRLEQVCHMNDLDFCFMEFAGTEVEDNLPIAVAQEDPNHPGTFKKLGYGPLYQEPKGRRKTGICLVNECLGADPRQQQQMRAFLSNRQLAGVPIHDGWIMVGDTNPLGSEYLDNKPMTRSLESRCMYIPVQGNYETSMNFWAGNARTDHLMLPEVGSPVPLTPGKIYEPLYMFLRMFGGDSDHSFFQAADPRRWTALSTVLARMHSAGLVSAGEQIKFLGYVLNDGVVAAYQTMLQTGTDPIHYPVQGHKFIQATEKDHKTHMGYLTKWEKDTNKNLLVGCTVYEVIGYLKGLGEDADLDPQEKTNLKDLITQVSDTHAGNIIESMTGRLAHKVWDLLWGTGKEKSLKDLAQRLEAVNNPKAAAAAGRGK